MAAPTQYTKIVKWKDVRDTILSLRSEHGSFLADLTVSDLWMRYGGKKDENDLYAVKYKIHQ